jgi:hypothetical protein
MLALLRVSLPTPGGKERTPLLTAQSRASAFASYQSMLFFMAILALKFSKSQPRRYEHEQR